jgi:hypothetical protein
MFMTLETEYPKVTISAKNKFFGLSKAENVK